MGQAGCACAAIPPAGSCRITILADPGWILSVGVGCLVAGALTVSSSPQTTTANRSLLVRRSGPSAAISPFGGSRCVCCAPNVPTSVPPPCKQVCPPLIHQKSCPRFPIPGTVGWYRVRCTRRTKRMTRTDQHLNTANDEQSCPGNAVEGEKKRKLPTRNQDPIKKVVKDADRLTTLADDQFLAPQMEDQGEYRKSWPWITTILPRTLPQLARERGRQCGENPPGPDGTRRTHWAL